MAGDRVGSGVPILPPRLEDAGLEDCALPPDSIAEAFSLAAEAVSSRLARFPLADSDDEEVEGDRIPGGCVHDDGHARGVFPDVLVSGSGGDGAADVVVVVGAGGGGSGDKVVTGGRGEEKDWVVVVGEGRGRRSLGRRKTASRASEKGLVNRDVRSRVMRKMRWW
jgi:hypothetical protein